MKLRTVHLAVGAAATLWAGLQVKPRAFPDYPGLTPSFETVDLPGDLPDPVARYFRTTVGERVPVITSAVITGRARLRIGGIAFPGRFRFVHTAGQGYRHYIEATLFGSPVLKVNEYYLDGKARLELPFSTVANEPKVNSAANLGLWAESVWLPSLYVTNPRARWGSVDGVTARLIVPFEGGDDALTATFDPVTGLLRRLEGLRYRSATDPAKILWRNEMTGWRRFHGLLIPSTGSVTWMDQGTPWFDFALDDVVYNVDVSAYSRVAGI